jgi:quaternary ammonium compound-resistance protein SugE
MRVEGGFSRATVSLYSIAGGATFARGDNRKMPICPRGTVVRGRLHEREAASGISCALTRIRSRRDSMAWLLLLVAGLFEIAWAIGLKYTVGFSRLWPSVFTVLAMVVSVVCLALALKTIPVGTGYAIWTGIGAAGTAILGIVLFGEAATVARLLCIGVILAGIIGLKIFSGEAGA